MTSDIKHSIIKKKAVNTINTTLVIRNVIRGTDEYSNSFGKLIAISKKEYAVKNLGKIGVGNYLDIKNLGLIKVEEMDYDQVENTLLLISHKRLDTREDWYRE